MKRFLLMTILVLCGVALGAQAEEDVEIPFLLPILEDWRTETIPFPLGFARELEYEGFEELRFAPGMFKPESEEFWTYAFVWWVPDSTEINAEILQRDLAAYYRGLANQEDKSGIHAKVSAVQGDQGFVGTIETIDTFVTMKPVSLKVRVEVIACDSQDRMAVFFEVSPQPKTHAVWAALQEIRQGFQCEKEATPLSR